jgi:hypothetical protein
MNCSICLKDINNNDKFITNCNHIFHLKCINKWYKISDKCPLCRHSKFYIDISYREDNYWKKAKEIQSLIDNETNIIFQY